MTTYLSPPPTTIENDQRNLLETLRKNEDEAKVAVEAAKKQIEETRIYLVRIQVQWVLRP